jgi:hypothetical protein
MNHITINLLTVGEEKLLRQVHLLTKRIKRGRINAFLTSAPLSIISGIGMRIGGFETSLVWLIFGMAVIACALTALIFYLFFHPRVRLNTSKLNNLLINKEVISGLKKLEGIRHLTERFPFHTLKWLSSSILIEKDLNQFCVRALTGYYG